MCGIINIICDYLHGVTFKRPDHKDEYRFISQRTIIIFISGPSITWVIWIAPVIAKWDLDI